MDKASNGSLKNQLKELAAGNKANLNLGKPEQVTIQSRIKSSEAEKED